MCKEKSSIVFVSVLKLLADCRQRLSRVQNWSAAEVNCALAKEGLKELNKLPIAEEQCALVEDALLKVNDIDTWSDISCLQSKLDNIIKSFSVSFSPE